MHSRPESSEAKYVWIVTSNHPDSYRLPAGVWSEADKASAWIDKQSTPSEWEMTYYQVDFVKG